MAKTAKYTEQMPFVGTKDQRDLVEALELSVNDSKAAVIRAGLSLLFGLVDDQIPPTEHASDLVDRAAEVVRNPHRYQVTEVNEPAAL